MITKLERAVKEDQRKVVNALLQQSAVGKKEVREFYQKRGFVAPNIVFLELTNQCNRRCVHCALPFASNETISLDTMVEVIGYFRERGTYGVGVVGGEPFLPAAREVLFEAAHIHRDIMFLVYTNGDFVDEKIVSHLDEVNNIIPLLSVDGTREYHNSLRGERSYEAVESATRLLEERKLAKGHSITISKKNKEILFEQELLDLMKADVILCTLRYRAVGRNPERKKVLSKGDYDDVYRKLLEFCKKNAIFFVSDITGTRDACFTSHGRSLYIDINGNIKQCAINKALIPFRKNMDLKAEMFQCCSVGESYGCTD